MRNDDGQWSQGLISAAQLVARSTGNLCEAANQAVQGDASEEKLITSAKQVASSTAQLLVACQVKADPNSENMKRLQVIFNFLVKHDLFLCVFFRLTNPFFSFALESMSRLIRLL